MTIKQLVVATRLNMAKTPEDIVLRYLEGDALTPSQVKMLLTAYPVVGKAKGYRTLRLDQVGEVGSVLLIKPSKQVVSMAQTVAASQRGCLSYTSDTDMEEPKFFATYRVDADVLLTHDMLLEISRLSRGSAVYQRTAKEREVMVAGRPMKGLLVAVLPGSTLRTQSKWPN